MHHAKTTVVTVREPDDLAGAEGSWSHLSSRENQIGAPSPVLTPMGPEQSIQFDQDTVASLVDLALEQSRRENALRQQIREAVERRDVLEVFRLSEVFVFSDGFLDPGGRRAERNLPAVA